MPTPSPLLLSNLHFLFLPLFYLQADFTEPPPVWELAESTLKDVHRLTLQSTVTLNCIVCMCAIAVQGATRADKSERPCSLCALQTHFLSRTVTHTRTYTHINAKLCTVPTKLRKQQHNSVMCVSLQALHRYQIQPRYGFGVVVGVRGRGEFSVSPKCELAAWKTSSILFYSELLKAYSSWDWNSLEATDYSCWHRTT